MRCKVTLLLRLIAFVIAFGERCDLRRMPESCASAESEELCCRKLASRKGSPSVSSQISLVNPCLWRIARR